MNEKAKERYLKGIELIRKGMTIREAASALFISEKTMCTGMQKLGIRVSYLRNVKGLNHVHKDGKWEGIYSVQEISGIVKLCGGFAGAAKALNTNHSRFKAWCLHNEIRVRDVLDSDEVAEYAPSIRTRGTSIGKNQYTHPKTSRVIYEKATIKDILIRNRWDGGLSLCASGGVLSRAQRPH